MATKTVTFDPDSGVPFGVNLVVYGGSNAVNNLEVKTTSGSNFDLTGYTGHSAISKSVGVGASNFQNAIFTVGFTSAYDGKIALTLTSAATTSISEGRYMYNVLVSSGTTTYNIINGDILVYQGISSAP